MGQCVLTDSYNPFNDDMDNQKFVWFLIIVIILLKIWLRYEKTMELYNRGRKQEETMGGSIKLIIGDFMFPAVLNS